MEKLNVNFLQQEKTLDLAANFCVSRPPHELSFKLLNQRIASFERNSYIELNPMAGPCRIDLCSMTDSIAVAKHSLPLLPFLPLLRFLV